MARRASRRRTLALLGTTLAGGLAGCGTSSNGSTPTEGGNATTPTSTSTATAEPETSPEPTGTVTDAGGTPTPDLDLREANVTAVDLSRTEQSYGFAVTLFHDDEGEDGYANWWQVETLDGDRLGRRELAHPHGTREFTRSATVDVPDGVDCVVVRGHDRTHGYGGQAMTVRMDDGATRVVRQGPERQSVDAC